MQFFKNFQSYSLYMWRESSSLSVWIKSLKGASNREDLKWVAEEMIRLYGYTLHRYPRVWLVAAPRAALPLDHSGYLVQELARILDQPLGPVVFKDSSYKQRFLNRQQRFGIRLKIPEINTWCPDLDDAVLLVDDVITTGGTAESIYKALGRPSNFFVWTLAYRGLSCGAAKLLI